jgi:predicted transposase YbfD/YdcC
LVTIDAMGCQKEIARQIRDQKADYCLAVKDNQPHLHEDLCHHFLACVENPESEVAVQEWQTRDRAHGHTDERYYFTTPVPKNLRHRKAWRGIRSVGMTMTYQNVEGDSDAEVRYYILSIPSNVQRFAAAVRGHWGIENSLHWVMDVTFGEDACRIGKDYGGENVSWLRRFAISLLKNEPTVKDSLRAKRNRAGWDIQYLEGVLAAAIQTDQENKEI